MLFSSPKSEFLSPHISTNIPQKVPATHTCPSSWLMISMEAKESAVRVIATEVSRHIQPKYANPYSFGVLWLGMV